jgi:DNA polymerase-3 subunit alpha
MRSASPTSTRCRYDLLFERFLNPERVSMPDFDIDFCMDRRDEVIDYVSAQVRRRQGQPDHHLRHDGGEGLRARLPAACSACRTAGVDGIAKLIPAAARSTR